MKKLFIFDLDGTLAESKSKISQEMVNTLDNLLTFKSVAIISGGNYQQFQTQFLSEFNLSIKKLQKLYLFPTCGTSFFQYKNQWKQIYSENLTEIEKQQIYQAFYNMFKELNFDTNNTYGDLLEDRLSQITFSALGQKAPNHLKHNWDPDHSKRLKMSQILKNYINQFEIRTGGSTSIDITRKGIDKAYGILQMEKYLNVNKQEMLFFGDALFPGGNDEPVKNIGVECVSVNNPQDTIEKINYYLRQ